ncbi:MAG: carbohydrate binding family 9 domain-containing protein [Cytophagales bacterium]|nr:carbohydrate binding family 9 domain-containing protein [Cytophagales bacterium]
MKNFKSLLLWVLIISTPEMQIFGQDNSNKTQQLHVKKALGKIKTDGILDEQDWQHANIATNFWQYFPMDTMTSNTISEAKITFDDQFIYVGFKVIDLEPGPWVTTSLRRDFRGNHNDVISVIFDPFSDKTNGMIFGINPYGVQREGLLSGITGASGSQSGFSLSWDNKWYSEARTYDGYWTAEIAIPFKTLRYRDGSTIWKANFYRLDSKTAERSTWNHIPRNQNIFSLAFSGDLTFDEPLPKPGANISMIPYLSGLVSKDFVEGSDTDYVGNIGGDLKIAVTPSLNLDLTFNPDFSQVEADVQQSNLTRFELFFPERRQFFLENQDIFASFGASGLRPFFSRRIGIARDPNTSLFVQNKIHYGARLSGRIDKNWRIGLMNLQTAKDESILRPGFNYSVFAIQRQMFTRSNISVIGINKQATNILENDSTLSNGFSRTDYNRLVGIDYNLASANNKWYGKLFYHQSISPGNNKSAFAHGVNIFYDVQALKLEWDHRIVGKNFNPEVGFAPRKDYNMIAPGIQFLFYPKSSIASHGPGVKTEYIWNHTYGKTDHQYIAYYELNFGSSATFTGGIRNDYTFLFEDFDPIEGPPLEAGSDYNYTSFVAEYDSDRRQNFYFELETQIGQFYNGSLVRFDGTLNYRLGIMGVASLNYSYNKISLPAPHSSGTIWLLGPRLDITFTKDIFLTTFFQYNSQIDNVNVNARLQYRYAPVSDFFMVYTENYFPDQFKSKNRALVAKLTYWFNI